MRLVLLSSLLLSGLIAGGCHGESAASAARPAAAPKPPPLAEAPKPPAAPSAETERPEPAGSLVVTGDLKPSEAAELSFKAGGQLAVRRVTRGDRVEKGQVLGQLSDTEAQAQLAQAEAAVAMARAQTAIATDQAQRVETLRTQDAAPGNAAVATKLQVEAAQAGVKQAEAATALARANVANHVLRAPFDGMVTRAPEGIGGTVGPGYPVFRLEKLDPLLLVGTLAEADLARVSVGDAATVDVGGRVVSGTVRAVVRSLEPVSRRVPIEITVPNPDGTLIAGAFVRARIGEPGAAPAVAPRTEGSAEKP